MEGIDRQPRLRRKNALVKPACLAQNVLIGRHTALGKESRNLGVTPCSQEMQPIDHALLDLARRLARKSDGQNLAGRDAGKQQAHDARSQQPGLATAGTRLHNDTARRLQRIEDGGAR